MEMITQTKYAIDDLKACGLRRNEFRVQVERIMRGRTFVGYGDALITLLCPLSRRLELAGRLAERFLVEQYVDEGRVRGMYIREAHGKPRLRKIDISKKEEEL
jgi:hypothetical protein